MQPAERSRARESAYRLLADLSARGPHRHRTEGLALHDGLAAGLASYGIDLQHSPPSAPAAAWDRAAAEHEFVLSRAAYPYAGVFLSRGAQMGGEAADRSDALYRRCGFAALTAPDSPDHLSTQLYALAWLSGAEGEAHEDGAQGAAERIQGLQRELLDGHLLRWLPAWSGAVRRLGRPFTTTLAAAVQALVADHRRELGSLPEHPGFGLDGPQLHLDDPALSLADIADWLCTPASVGFLLMAPELAAVAQRLALPRGFGDRRRTLRTLLQQASRFGALPSLWSSLSEVVRAHRADHLEQAAAWPSMAASARPWIAALDATLHTLEALSSQTTLDTAEGA
jgi:TorA maturation chaperone TorD